MAYSLDPLTEISQFESGGQNVPNYEYSPEHTASGPWQINISTWNSQVAPNTGLPTVSYPAGVMSLPTDVQQQGAAYLYNTQGFAPWAPYNPGLSADIASAGGASAYPQPGTYQPAAGAIPGSTGDLSGFGGNQDFTGGATDAAGATNPGGTWMTDPSTGVTTYYPPGSSTPTTIGPGGSMTGDQYSSPLPSLGSGLSSLWQDVINFAERGGIFVLGLLVGGIALWAMVSHSEAAQSVRSAALAAVE